MLPAERFSIDNAVLVLPEGLQLGIIAGKHALFDFENPYMVHGHPLLLWLNQNPFMAIV